MRGLILVTIGAVLAIVSVSALALYYFERPTILRVAVTRGGDDQQVLAAAAHEFAQTRQSLRLKPVLVDSLSEASHDFEDESVDLAIVRSDISMPVTGQTVLIMRHEAALLVAPTGSDLKSVEELRGRKVGVLDELGRPGNHSLLDAALTQYGVSPASVRRVPLTLAELPDAIEQREIDVVLCVGTPGSPNLTAIVAAVAQAGHGPPVFIPIDDADAIKQRSPIFELIEIVRGAFGGAQPKPSESFDTLGVSTRLIARRSLSNDVVSNLTELILNAKPSLAAHNPIANYIEAPPTDKGAGLPVHPGTLAYLGDEEQSFFDKYSDFIYIGAMLASLFGTAIAALATRLNRKQNADLERILQRLLEIISAARAASRLETLDELESEADNLLAQALAHDWNHALSGTRIAATDLALNQTRYAIAARRRQLAAPRAGFTPRVVGE